MLLVTTEVPSDPLTFSYFTKYWNMDRAHLRVTKPGSDVGDFCTFLRNNLFCIKKNDARYEVLNNFLDVYRKNAGLEHAYYQKCLEDSAKDASAPQHSVFKFSEMVLLSQLIRQPKQLYFITGFKFQLFGVHDSNKCTTTIYSLTDSHWPQEKTANSFITMLHQFLSFIETRSRGVHNMKKLILRADNCAEQNKNSFMLMFTAWRCIVGFNDYVKLCFEVA